MALVYDQLGNIIGDDGTPDIPTRPDVDAMQFELAKKNTQPQMSIGEMGSNFLGNLKDYEQKLGLTNLKKLIGQIPAVKAVQPVAEVPISLASSVPAAFAYGYVPPGSPRKAYDEAQARSAALQYQSDNPYTNQILEDLGETFKGMPAYIPTAGAFRPRSTDVRVLRAQALAAGKEIGDIKADFINAQGGGPKRVDAAGNPTYGVSIQQMADELGNYAQRQKERGKPIVSILGANLVPETKLNAVRNVNEGQLLRPVDTESRTLANATEGDTTRSMPGIGKVLSKLETVNLDNPTAIIEAYSGIVAPAVMGAYNDYVRKKVSEMYPYIDDVTGAYRAYNMGISPERQAQNRVKWLDEFTQTPEAQALAASENSQLPTLAEFTDRVKAAESFKAGPFTQQIAKYAGTAEDPLLQAARQGVTVYSPNNLLTESAMGDANAAAKARASAVSPQYPQGREPLGEYAKELADSNTKIAELKAKVDEITQRRMATAPDSEANRVTTNLRNDAIIALEREQENNQNIQVARAYEIASDLSVKKGAASNFASTIDPRYRQFFPQLQDTRTPSNAPMFDIDRVRFELTGLPVLGQQYVNAIMKGEIPPNQVNNISLAKFLKKSVEPRIAQEIADRRNSTVRLETLNNALPNIVNTIPNDLRFGNVGVIEVTKDMPRIDRLRNFSLATEFLDVCTGEDGSGGNAKLHFLTGKPRWYTPILDYVTGETFQGSTGVERRNYSSNVQKGDKISDIHDLNTGHVVAQIEFNKIDSTTASTPRYNINYVSGYHNQTIKPEYQAAIKDYLNSRAFEIISAGPHLTDNIALYDAKSRSNVTAALDKIGKPRDAIPNSVIQSELPRFFTKEDIKALIPTQAAAISYQGDLESLRLQKNELQDRINNGYYADADEINTVQQQVDEFDREIARVEQQIAEQGEQRPRRLPDIFAPDVTPQIGQVLRDLVESERNILASNIALMDPMETEDVRITFQELLADTLELHPVAERPFDFIEELRNLEVNIDNEIDETPAIRQLHALARMVEERLNDFGIQYGDFAAWEPEPEMRMPVAQQPPAAPVRIDYFSVIEDVLDNERPGALVRDSYEDAMGGLVSLYGDTPQTLLGNLRDYIAEIAPLHLNGVVDRDILRAYGLRTSGQAHQLSDAFVATAARIEREMGMPVAQQPPAAPAQIDYASVRDNVINDTRAGVQVRETYTWYINRDAHVHGNDPQAVIGRLRDYIAEVSPLQDNVVDSAALRRYGIRTNRQARQLVDMLLATITRIEREMGRQREVFPGQLVPEEQVPNEVRADMLDQQIEGMAEDIMDALDASYDFNNVEPATIRSLIQSLREGNVEDVLGMATPDFEIDGEIPPALIRSLVARLRNTLRGIEDNIAMMNENEGDRPYATPNEAFVTFVNANDQFEGPDGLERLNTLLQFIQRPNLRENLHLQNFTPEQIQELDELLRNYARQLNRPPGRKDGGVVRMAEGGGVSSLHPLVQAAVARGDIPSNQARYYHDMYTTKGSMQDESAIRGMSEKEYNYYSKLLKDKQLQKNFYGGEIPERRPPPPSSPANLDLSREQLRALSYKEFGAPRSPFKLGASDNANVYPGASDAKYYDELKQAAAKDPSYQPYQDELTKLLQQNPSLSQTQNSFADGGIVSVDAMKYALMRNK